MSEKFSSERTDILAFDDQEWEDLEYLHSASPQEDFRQYFNSGEGRVVLMHNRKNPNQYSFVFDSPQNDLIMKIYNVKVYSSADQAQLAVYQTVKEGVATDKFAQEWIKCQEETGMSIPTTHELFEFKDIFRDYCEFLETLTRE